MAHAPHSTTTAGTPSCCGGHHHDAPAIDPVCGMKVDPATAKHSAHHDGTDYFFCSGGCRAKFVADPAKYLAAEGRCRADAGRHDLHLPDASRDPPARPRKLPASAAWRWSPKWSPPTADPTPNSPT